MNGLRSIRPLSRDSLRGVKVMPIVGHVPTLELANPRDLFVEDYQRDIRENGTALIRRIVGNFSWHKFKPPVCFRSAEADGALVVIDGQHTATAAASRGIPLIPIVVVSEDASIADRAHAFVGHNKDRLALTQQTVFAAQLAAGDKMAISVRDACAKAGVTILPYAVNLAEERNVGETIAIGILNKTAQRFGPEWLIRVLKVLVAAKRGPIKAQEISAVSNVLGHVGDVPGIDTRLADLIASKKAKQWAALAAAIDGTITHALTTLWMRELDVRAPDKAREDFEKRMSEGAKPKPEPVKPAEKPVAKVIREAIDPDLAKRLIERESPRPPPPPAPRPRAQVILAESNGIRVAIDGTVTRSGYARSVNVGEFGAKLLARLVNVMPAQIGFDRLALNVFGAKPNGRILLDDLVLAIKVELRPIGLEIYRVERSGFMLREANSGENLLRA